MQVAESDIFYCEFIMTPCHEQESECTEVAGASLLFVHITLLHVLNTVNNACVLSAVVLEPPFVYIATCILPGPGIIMRVC